MIKKPKILLLLKLCHQAKQFYLSKPPTGVLTAAIRHWPTLQPEAWRAACSFRSSVWVAVLVPVAGEATGDAEDIGTAFCQVDTMSGGPLCVGYNHHWKWQS